ncbi:hypothetical protein ZIOFF_013832 [Zingiber officinale]|uniref:Reverse transcriptase domain-containing protein n=1 Tax=Zingiber officinale TaxID=94328 RepID=A0A8J5HNG2_ZINOF|nr:hypothetical protein ZIOFF_013832 [Zingiber officinale]
MDPDSISWTAFWVPEGLFEWLVMPFGLKNAPAIFQRKMDNCFRGTEKFIAVYIDDILVFSETEEEHQEHLKVLLNICRRNGLILSPTKMKIGSSTIEFLGATIGNSKIRLQPHIISKVADFKNEELQTTKGLRSWLGILNYARSYIPNLGKILGPLYSKTSPNGEKRMNGQDWALVDKVKSIIKNLPELAIPPAQCYVIIEADGCMEGWGGVLKWKPQKYDPKTAELVSAYASGKPMDPYKRRRIGSSTMGGYYYSTPSQAQQSGNSTSEEPYHFLAQYKEVTHSRGPGVCTVLEEDARKHLADIEKTVANQLIHNILELKLIQDIKEADFSIRSKHPKGLYFKDSLPRVTAVKSSLFGAFLQLQGVIQEMVDTPP